VKQTVSDEEEQTVSHEDERIFPIKESQTLSANVEQTSANGEDQALNTPTPFKPQINLLPTQTLRKPFAPPVYNKASSEALSPAPLVDDDLSQGSPRATKANTGQTGAAKKLSFLRAALRAPKAAQILSESASGQLREHKGVDLLERPGTRRFFSQYHLDTALLDSCATGRGRLVSDLLKHDANAHAVEDRLNSTPHYIWPTNMVRCQGASPLMLASYWNNTEIVQLLLRQGADVQYHPQGPVQIGGYTSVGSALIAAALQDNSRVAEILLAAGASINDQPHGFAALHAACSPRHSRTAKCLLENGAEVDICSAKWGTPLMRALLCHNNEVVRLLIQKGANVKYRMECPNRYGHRTPMDAAPCLDGPLQVELLVEKGAVGELQEAIELKERSLKLRSNPYISDLLRQHVGRLEKIEATQDFKYAQLRIPQYTYFEQKS